MIDEIKKGNEFGCATSRRRAEPIPTNEGSAMHSIRGNTFVMDARERKIRRSPMNRGNNRR